MFSKTLLVLLVMYFSSDFSHGRKENKFFRKDYTYINIFDSFYKIHTTIRTFADAKQMCVLEGASLFHPEDDDEANAVIAYWKTIQPSTSWSVLLGLTDSKEEGEFVTIDEIPIADVYKQWREDEPNDQGSGEDCVIMNQEGTMNDVPCADKFPFICKKKDYSYIQAVDSYYKIYSTQRTFAEAKRTCGLEGASLFYPENEKEAHAVIEFWNNTQPSVDAELIVGMSDLMTEGVFETIDGKLIYNVYDQWLTGGPSDTDGSKDCIKMNRHGYIHDVKCTEKYRFICKRLLPPQWNDKCNMANLDYTFSENIGKCYKLHTTPMTWTEAYGVCRAEQSYLTVINNTLEADYLSSLTKSVANKRVEGIYQRGIYHVGVHNRLNEGWQTVTGQSISDASAWWGNFFPAADDEKQCGSMFYTGLLNNIDCDTKSFFICEHDVDGLTALQTSKFSSDNEENFQ